MADLSLQPSRAQRDTVWPEAPTVSHTVSSAQLLSPTPAKPDILIGRAFQGLRGERFTSQRNRVGVDIPNLLG